MFKTATYVKLALYMFFFFSFFTFTYGQENSSPSPTPYLPKICKLNPYSFECAACSGFQESELNICNLCRGNPDIDFVLVGRDSIKEVLRENECSITASRKFYSKPLAKLLDVYDGLLFNADSVDLDSTINSRLTTLGFIAFFLFVYPLIIFGFFITTPFWKKIFKSKFDLTKKIFLIINLPFLFLTANAYMYLFLNLLNPIDKDYIIDCDINNLEEINDVYLTLLDGIELHNGSDVKIVFGDEFNCDSSIKIVDYLEEGEG